MSGESGLGTLDPFRTVLSWDSTTAADWAAALDQRAACADQVRLRSMLRDLAVLRPGDHGVELGCGTGALLAELADTVGSGGRVLGVEPQPAFADAARRRAAAVPDGGAVTVHTGSAEHIPAADATVDACLAQTVLIHLPDPVLRSALTDARRVLRPGGRFVTADQDGDTWVVDHPDRETTRRIATFNSDQRYADGWTGRRMARLLAEAGYREVSVRVLTHLDTAADSYLFGMSMRLARAAEEAGAIGAGRSAEWIAALQDRAKTGAFLSSISYFLCVGTR
ncbi:MAG: methyltransferase domain-containing protein [Pseudonocardiaceae bacterium]